MDLGDRIQRAWTSFVRQNIDGRALRRELRSIEWGDQPERVELYFYVVIAGADAEPYIERFEGPMWSDYFQGAGSSRLVVAIPVHEGMTKQDLLDVDVADESNYWDHPDWSNG